MILFDQDIHRGSIAISEGEKSCSIRYGIDDQAIDTAASHIQANEHFRPRPIHVRDSFVPRNTVVAQDLNGHGAFGRGARQEIGNGGEKRLPNHAPQRQMIDGGRKRAVAGGGGTPIDRDPVEGRIARRFAKLQPQPGLNRGVESLGDSHRFERSWLASAAGAKDLAGRGFHLDLRTRLDGSLIGVVFEQDEGIDNGVDDGRLQVFRRGHGPAVRTVGDEEAKPRTPVFDARFDDEGDVARRNRIRPRTGGFRKRRIQNTRQNAGLQCRFRDSMPPQARSQQQREQGGTALNLACGRDRLPCSPRL